MQPTALFVNTSRAGLIEPGALVAALRAVARAGRRRRLRGRARSPTSTTRFWPWTTWSARPTSATSPRDEWELQFPDIFDQINAYAAGRPINVVNPAVLDGTADPTGRRHRDLPRVRRLRWAHGRRPTEKGTTPWPETCNWLIPSTIPELCGRFEPVTHEIDADDLPVEGTLPTDLTGLRSQWPQPQVHPLGSYTYPMEGDAMIHGLWIEHGQARYANRWVRTQGHGRRGAGRSCPLRRPHDPGVRRPSAARTRPDPGWPTRLDPFINIVRHAGRYLALEEGPPPYEVTYRIGTVGRFDFAGGCPPGMCAHPKIDPVTGEMVVFRYDVEEPFLTWAVWAPDGTVTRRPTPVDGVDRLHGPRLRHHRAPPRVDRSAPPSSTSEAMLGRRGPSVAARTRDADRRDPPRRLVGPDVDPHRGLLGLALRQRLRGARRRAATPTFASCDFPWWSRSPGVSPGTVGRPEAHSPGPRWTPARNLDLHHLDALATEFPGSTTDCSDGAPLSDRRRASRAARPGPLRTRPAGPLRHGVGDVAGVRLRRRHRRGRLAPDPGGPTSSTATT